MTRRQIPRVPVVGRKRLRVVNKINLFGVNTFKWALSKAFVNYNFFFSVKNPLMRRFTVRNIIGEGATGVVYRAINQHNEEVAIKMVPKSKNIGKCVQKEVNMLSSLNHENILNLVDFYETKNNYYIVTELCDSNLICFINEYNIDESVALKILRMILCGVHHIHSKGIIHRDIKLGNLLIKGNSVKICDFGLSCFSIENNNTFCGTEDYLAPEIKSRRDYDKSVDIYSIGKSFTRC